jgi:putative ABC transport system permease protein
LHHYFRVVTGLLAGIYPALYLSVFKPVSILKGTFSFKPSATLLRKGLVIFQFVIAIVLIISVIVISRQLNYMQSIDLGFDQKQKLIIPFQNDESRQNFSAYTNEVKKLKDVTGVTGCVYYPSLAVLSDVAVYKSGQDMKSAKLLKVNSVNEDFFKVMDIPLLTGRQLRSSDTSRQVIVNEKALKVLEIDKDKAAGTHVYFDFEGNHMDYEIVGVTKDYNYSSLKEEVQPLMTFYNGQPNYMIVGTTSDNYKSLLSDMASIWKKNHCRYTI